MELLTNPNLWFEMPVATVAAAMSEHAVRTLRLIAAKKDRPVFAMVLIHGDDTQAMLNALEAAERDLDGRVVGEKAKKVPCEACGATDYDGELRTCPHCERSKCSRCDMGNDVGCAMCEIEWGDV